MTLIFLLMTLKLTLILTSLLTLIFSTNRSRTEERTESEQRETQRERKEDEARAKPEKNNIELERKSRTKPRGSQEEAVKNPLEAVRKR